MVEYNYCKLNYVTCVEYHSTNSRTFCRIQLLYLYFAILYHQQIHEFCTDFASTSIVTAITRVESCCYVNGTTQSLEYNYGNYVLQ